MLDDGALFQAWRGGDREAGAALIERHFDALERFFATKFGGAADDLVQRSFLACAEAVGSFRGEGTFRAFLFGIARNVLYEHLRGRVRHGAAPPDFSESGIFDLAPGTSTLVGHRSEVRALVAALQQLPLELQLLVELYYWDELGVDELAAVLELPPGTIKSRLHRARTLLAGAMHAPPPRDADDDGSVRGLLLDWLGAVKSGAPRPG